VIIILVEYENIDSIAFNEFDGKWIWEIRKVVFPSAGKPDHEGHAFSNLIRFGIRFRFAFPFQMAAMSRRLAFPA